MGIVIMGAVMVLAALPTLAYADITVNGAHYDWDDNILNLTFTQPINIFPIDLTKVTVADDWCATVFDHFDLVGVSSDRMSITIQPNDVGIRSMASMLDPYVVFHAGSFSDDDGEMAPLEVWLGMSGEPPDLPDKCIITYGSNELLLSVYAHDYNQTIQAVHDGFTAWSNLNPYLEFVWVENNPLIYIEWVEYNPEYIGSACVWCVGYDATMEVVLYGYDCTGSRIHHDTNTVRNTVAHELGHILGLDHHTDESNLMYGPEYQVVPYESYGYVVPDLLEEWFIGEAELYGQIEILEAMLDALGAELDELDAELTELEAKGDKVGNTIYFDSQNQANQYNWLISEYNKMWDEYDEVWNEYDGLYNEWDCMYGAEDMELVS